MKIPENPPAEVIDLFPKSVLDLVGIGGLIATIALINHFGGTRIIFSQTSHNHHELISLIGIEAFKSYSDCFQGELVSIPMCASAKKWLDNQELFQDIGKGLSLSELARKHGYSERTISKFKKQLSQAA